MRRDLWKYGSVIAAATLLGLLIGYTFEVLAAAALSVLAWQMLRLDMLYKWVRNPNNEPIPEQSGQIYQLHKELSRKFVRHKHSKRQLKTFLSQFRKAASAIPDAIVLINEGNKIEWANNNAMRLLGVEWPRDSQVRFVDLVRDPDVIELLSQQAADLDGIEFSHPSNRHQTLNLKCVRYTKELRMVIARDISRLITVNKMQADFVANVSHELKTPLTVLKGYLEILTDHPNLDEKLSKPVQQMSFQSERMQLIVNDLLYLAKLEDSAYITEHQPIDLTHLVNAIIESIQPVIESRHHKIELNIDYAIQILGNQSELHSALSNLITNAIKYTDDNGLISISWEREGLGATLLVKDNGSGIPSSAIPLLTKRFYRVDDDRSREGGGTGLGLAIVKHVMHRHNAKLEIDSLIGVGSEFRCVFPPDQLIFVAQQKDATQN